VRLLIAALVVAVGALAGYVAWLNGDPVTLRLGGDRVMDVPLAGALFAAFALGGTVVGLIALLGAIRRQWRAFWERRHQRRAARQLAETDRARRLAWAEAPDEARATILRAERGTPSDRARAEIVAETYLSEANLDGAHDSLIAALERHPGDVRLLDLFATVAERRGDTTRAIEVLSRARREDPDNPRLARRLRDLYVREGAWRDALRIQDEIISRLKHPDALTAEEAMAQGLRFEVAREGTDPERSAKALASLGRAHPDFLPAWVEAGDRFLAAGKPAKARKVWERGVAHRPDGVLLDRLEALDASEGAASRTTQRYRALLSTRPSDALRRRLARHLLLSGDVAGAAQEISRLDGSSAANAALLGEMLRRRGEHHQAAEAFSRALGPTLGLETAPRCIACGRDVSSWTARCDSCGGWGTIAAGSVDA